MRLYARLWRARLWTIHFAILAGATLGVGTLLAETRAGPGPWIAGAAVGLACIAAMASWPLLAFKSQQRVLVVSQDGLRTTIGNRSGSMAWSDVQSVERADNCVHIVRNNLNTFVVPRRAFASEAELEGFLQAINGWLAASR